MRKRTKFLFYALSIYVITQFSWWAYLLIEVNEKTALVSLNEPSFKDRFWMIAGEGTVFFALLVTGITMIYINLNKAAKIARAERNFMLAITHELKTPLASTRLLLQTLKEKELSREQQQEILGSAISENQRLSTLTENILLAARIEQKEDLMIRYEINLRQTIEEMLSYLEKTMARDHDLNMNVPEDLTFIGDETGIQSVISNLLDNAVKYSPKGTEITISAWEENKKLTLEIADQGNGIAKAEVANVFKKFYRVGDENVRTTKGSGLGLYIARLIVKWHDGTVEALPNHPKGTIMRVILPIE